MNNIATIQKMNQMRLYGMVRTYNEIMESTKSLSDFTLDELLATIVESEWEYRQNKKIDRLLKAGMFRYQAVFEQIDFTFTRKLDKNMILRLSDCNWINKKQNIIITGPTGIGKSYIGTALGNKACLFGYKTLYYNTAKLFSALKLSKADGTYEKRIKNIQKQDLLILDDFGLYPLDIQSCLFLLEIIEDRHGLKSTIICTQIPVSNWHDIIIDSTIADAICDRLVHSAIRIELQGESLRKKKIID